MEKEIKKDVDAAVEKARADPYPDKEDLVRDIYIEDPSNLRNIF